MHDKLNNISMSPSSSWTCESLVFRTPSLEAKDPFPRCCPGTAIDCLYTIYREHTKQNIDKLALTRGCERRCLDFKVRANKLGGFVRAGRMKGDLLSRCRRTFSGEGLRRHQPGHANVVGRRRRAATTEKDKLNALCNNPLGRLSSSGSDLPSILQYVRSLRRHVL